MLGQRDQQTNLAPYIYIQENPLKPEAIRISFDSEAELNRWLQVVQQSRKTNEQLLEAIRKKEEEKSRQSEIEQEERKRSEMQSRA